MSLTYKQSRRSPSIAAVQNELTTLHKNHEALSLQHPVGRHARDWLIGWACLVETVPGGVGLASSGTWGPCGFWQAQVLFLE